MSQSSHVSSTVLWVFKYNKDNYINDKKTLNVCQEEVTTKFTKEENYMISHSNVKAYLTRYYLR